MFKTVSIPTVLICLSLMQPGASAQVEVELAAEELLARIDRNQRMSVGSARTMMQGLEGQSQPAMVLELALLEAFGPEDVRNPAQALDRLRGLLQDENVPRAGPFRALLETLERELVLRTELVREVMDLRAQRDRERQAHAETRAKLEALRALQEQSVRPVGSNREIAVDVRVMAATHRDLDRAMADGDFREDLYYRLNVVRLDVPDLRDRPEDIPLLAEHFLAQFQADRPASERIGGFAPEAMQSLVEYDWPGNVRQLRNVIEQVCAFCRQGPVPADRVRRALRGESRALPSLAEARDGFERDYLARVLRLTGGNVSHAARLAGRNRTEFYRLLKRHALDPARFKDSEAAD